MFKPLGVNINFLEKVKLKRIESQKKKFSCPFASPVRYRSGDRFKWLWFTKKKRSDLVKFEKNYDSMRLKNLN